MILGHLFLGRTRCIKEVILSAFQGLGEGGASIVLLNLGNGGVMLQGKTCLSFWYCVSLAAAVAVLWQ